MLLRRSLLALPAALAAQTPGPQSDDVQRELAQYRAEIDKLDDRIVDLLSSRAEIVRKVGNLKKRAGLPVSAPGREKQVLDRVAARASRGPLPPEMVAGFYKQIMAGMSAWEASETGAKPK